jgi:hypothetical protein
MADRQPDGPAAEKGMGSVGTVTAHRGDTTRPEDRLPARGHKQSGMDVT